MVAQKVTFLMVFEFSLGSYKIMKNFSNKLVHSKCE